MSLAACVLLMAQSSDFSQAMSLVAEGQYAEAHALIATIESSVEQAQAEVYLRLRAGDLPGALQAANEGIRVAPDDLWLHERRASTALSLGAAQLLGQAVEDFRLAALRVPGNVGSDQALTRLQDVLEQVKAAEETRATALTRARMTVVASLALLLGLLAYFARSRA